MPRSVPKSSPVPPSTLGPPRTGGADRVAADHKGAAAPAFGRPPTAMPAELAELFPLPLSPLEKYLVWDDRENCPMTSFIELQFAGLLCVDAMSEALTNTIHRHPLLASRLIQTAEGLAWEYDPHFLARLRDPDFDPPLIEHPECVDPSPRAIDLFDEPGCRYWYQPTKDPGGSRLLIQLHHACCDGVGLRQVLIDALSRYVSNVTSAVRKNERANAPEACEFEPASSPSPRSRRRQLQPARLRGRADFSERKAKPVVAALSTWDKLRNAFYFHFQRPDALAVPDRSNRQEERPRATRLRGSPASDQPMLHHVFGVDTSKKIQAACRDRSVAINDLALAILFDVCHQWNQEFGGRGRSSRLRVLMPVDLRSREDMRMPAANRLSFAFLGRTARQCVAWPELLASVQAETQWIKDSRVYLDFLDGLDALADRPNLMKRAIRWSHHMSTSALTYAGDISRGMKHEFPERDGRRRIGDVDLAKILIVPPARRGTNVTLGLCVNWGQICISANWNRTAFTAADCREFLDRYGRAWEAWLIDGDPTRKPD